MFYCFSQYISCFILLPSMSYCFSGMYPCFLTSLITLMMLAQPSWARIYLNTLFVLRSTCFDALHHVSMLLCHACAQIYMLLCSLPCLGVQIYMLDAMSSVWLCLFVSYYVSFLYFGPQVGCRSRSIGLGLHPYTQAYNKGFESFPLCMCMLACLYALDPCLFDQIQALAMLCALRRFVLVGLWDHLPVWLHLSLLWFVWMQPFTGTHLRDVGLLDACPFPLRVMICLPSFLCAILFDSFCFFVSLHVCLYVHACIFVCACLCHQSQFLETHAGSYPSLIHEAPSPFQELCLMAHVLFILQFNGTTDTRFKPTFVLL